MSWCANIIFQTGSSLAHSLLNHWERSLGEFVRVIPFEYKKRFGRSFTDA